MYVHYLGILKKTPLETQTPVPPILMYTGMKGPLIAHNNMIVVVCIALLLLLTTTTVSWASYVCSTPQPPSTVDIVISGGYTSMMPGCEYDTGGPTTLITIDVGAAVDAAQAASNTTAVFRATGTRFNETHLVFNATPGHTTATPFDLVISGCEYTATTQSLVFTGAFPVGSTLLIDGNTMSWNTPSTATRMGGVALTNALLVGSTTRFEVTSNTLVSLGYPRPVVTIGGSGGTYGPPSNSSTNLTDGTVVEVSNNTATFLGGVSIVFPLADLSGFVVVARDLTDQVDISSGSLLNVTGNTVTCNDGTRYGFFLVVGFGSGYTSLEEGAIVLVSSLRVSMLVDNYFSVVGAGRDGMLMLDTASSLSIAHIYIETNITVSSPSQAGIFYCLKCVMDVANNSTVMIEDVAMHLSTNPLTTPSTLYSVAGFITSTGGRIDLRDGSMVTFQNFLFQVEGSTASLRAKAVSAATSAPLTLSNGSRIVVSGGVYRGYFNSVALWDVPPQIHNYSSVVVESCIVDIHLGAGGLGGGMFSVKSGVISNHSSVILQNHSLATIGGYIHHILTSTSTTVTGSSTFVFRHSTYNHTVLAGEALSAIMCYMSAALYDNSEALFDHNTLTYQTMGKAGILQAVLGYVGTSVSDSIVAVRNCVMRATGVASSMQGSTMFATENAIMYDRGTILCSSNTVVFDLLVDNPTITVGVLLFLGSQFSTSARLLVADNDVILKFITAPGASNDIDPTTVYFSSGVTAVPTSVTTTYPLFEIARNNFQIHINSTTSTNCALYDYNCAANNGGAPIPMISMILAGGWDATFGGPAFQISHNIITLTLENRFVGSSANMFAVSTSVVAPQSLHPIPITSYFNLFNVVMLNTSNPMPPLSAGWLMNSSVSLIACGDRVMSPTGEIPCVDEACYPYNPDTNSTYQVLNCTATLTHTSTSELPLTPTPTHLRTQTKYGASSRTNTASPTHAFNHTPTPSDTIHTTPTISHLRTHTSTAAAPPRTATVTPAPTSTPPPTSPSPCNTTLSTHRLSVLPLFVMTRTAQDIRTGFEVFATISLDTDSPLLDASNATTPLPDVSGAVIRKSVAGNADGFASNIPHIDVYVINTSAIRIVIVSTPPYDIAEDEGLTVSLPIVHIVGASCNSGGGVVPIGQVTVISDSELYGAPSSVATTVVGGGASVVGLGGSAGLAAEQQGLSAVVMFSCADPHSREAFGSYRALSPFAIFESYTGVVLGNAIALGVIGLIHVVVLGVLRACRRTRRMIQIMSDARFPAMTLNVLFAFHTGTAYAASQLIAMSGDFEGWEVAVGGIGFAYAVVVPFILTVHPYLRIGRAYQEYQMIEWLEGLKWPSWVVHIAPEGAMYSPETRRAYGSYVSSYRAPASQVWWTSYPTWTACIIGIGGLFHPSDVIGCQVLFVAMGVAFLTTSAILVWRRPLRSLMGNHLGVAAKVVMGLVLFSLAASLTNPRDGSTAVIIFGYIMTALTILRVIHAFVGMYFDHRMAKDEVALTTVWSHVPGESKKSTHAFSIDGADLGDEATRRGTQDEPLIEMEANPPPSSSSPNIGSKNNTNNTNKPSDDDSDPLHLHDESSGNGADISSDDEDTNNENDDNIIPAITSKGSSSGAASSSSSSSPEALLSLGSTDDDLL